MKHMKKKFLPLLLAAAMVLLLVPGGAFKASAASDTYFIDYGHIEIAQNADDSSKLDVTHSATSGAASTIDTIPATDDIVITQTDSSTPANNFIYVFGDIANVNITLSGVNIDELGKENTNALAFAADTAANLTLIGKNTLKSGINSAGIGEVPGASLTITAASTGSLTATGGEGGDGIGGNFFSSGGTVTIAGGTVTANGTAFFDDSINGYSPCAGIGDSLYISGGSVNANTVPENVYQSSAQTTKVYKTIVTGLPKSTPVTCSVNGGNEFSCETDGNGYIYLWLPAGNGALQVNCGSRYFIAGGIVATDNSTTFTVEEYHMLSSSVNLSALSVYGGILSPAFTSNKVAYSVSTSSDSFGDSIKVTATTAIAGATLTIGGNPATSGTATTVSLVNGTNQIPIVVTSPDKLSQKAYILTVTGTVSPPDPYITIVNSAAFTVTLHNTGGKYTGTDMSTDYGKIIGTASGNDTILTGTLTNVPTIWTELSLNGDKVMIKAIAAPSTTVSNPSFY